MTKTDQRTKKKNNNIKSLFADWQRTSFALEDVLADFWQSIAPCSKKTFIWMFAIINVVFLWHTVTFFFGNHDWGYIKTGFGFGWSLFDGRWGAGVIQQAVGGDVLPVLNNLFCFAGFCLAMIALAKYWELPKTTLTYTVFGLFIMLLPYTYPWLQYVRSETHFWNILLIVLALFWCEKKKFLPQLAACVIFVFSLGCYPATIEAIVSIFLGRCLLTVWFDNPSLNDLIKKYYPHVINIFVSFVVFALIFEWMKRSGPTLVLPTVETVTMMTLVQNILKLPHALWTTFVDDTIYLPTGFKLFLGLSFPFVIYLMTQKSYRQNLLIGALMIAVIISPLIIDLLSANDYAAQLRLDFFAVPYVYALGWTILLRQKENLLKNMALILMMMAIYFAGLQAFRDQKVKYFDWQREMKVFDDIRSRIKANPMFSPNEHYHIYVMGELDSLSKVTPFDHYNKKMQWENSWVPFVTIWNVKDFFDFYEKDSFADLYYLTGDLEFSDEEMKNMDFDYLMHRARPWPHRDGVYVQPGRIYIIIDDEALNKVREQIVSRGYMKQEDSMISH